MNTRPLGHPQILEPQPQHLAAAQLHQAPSPPPSPDPEAVLAGVDAHAARLGISRVEYIRRRLAADAATSSAKVST
jgi:hypothetical protein